MKVKYRARSAKVASRLFGALFQADFSVDKSLAPPYVIVAGSGPKKSEEELSALVGDLPVERISIEYEDGELEEEGE